MRVYIRKPLFYLILVLIALLPLSKKAGLLISGGRTTGTVADYGINETYRREAQVTILSFTVNGKEYFAETPLNVIYELGEQKTILYDKDDPAHNTLLTFTSLYSGKGLILALFVLMVWMAFYTTWGAKDLPKKKGKTNNNWPRIEE